MATEAQVQANRLNAKKSTGPRTAAGKAAVAQNAVRHGFLSRLDVIRGEEQAEFDLFREQMLGELAPAGVMETMLAERIVGLSWRLKRAERMQSEAFEALLTPDTSNLAVRIAQSLRPKRSEAEENADSELAFGRAVVKDFGHGRVLDRLLMYERRMEHSLYRTMAELQRLRLVGEVAGTTGEPVRSGPGTVGAGFKPARTPSEETPAGVATNAPAAADESCKTKPICVDADMSQVPASTEVKEDSAENGHCETKPIHAGGFETRPCEGTPDAGTGAGTREQGVFA
jgi:hypothetical protein